MALLQHYEEQKGVLLKIYDRLVEDGFIPCKGLGDNWDRKFIEGQKKNL